MPFTRKIPWFVTYVLSRFLWKPLWRSIMKKFTNTFRRKTCHICEKPFKLAVHLYHHKKTHNAERKHNCQQCGKCFLKATHLNQHILSHSGEMPYQCDLCERCFSSKSSLKKHMIACHEEATDDKACSCGLCGKLFTTSKKLKAEVWELLHLRKMVC